MSYEHNYPNSSLFSYNRNRPSSAFPLRLFFALSGKPSNFWVLSYAETNKLIAVFPTIIISYFRSISRNATSFTPSLHSNLKYRCIFYSISKNFISPLINSITDRPLTKLTQNLLIIFYCSIFKESFEFE